MVPSFSSDNVDHSRPVANSSMATSEAQNTNVSVRPVTSLKSLSSFAKGLYL